MAVISARELGKSFGRGASMRWAVRSVSLELGAGAVLGLLGPNGAGKTTLIKMLSGLLRPDAGSATVLGHDLVRRPARVRAEVSLVSPTSDVGIDQNLTVRQNLEFWAPIYGLHGERARRRVDELLERLSLAGKQGAWPMHISSGERQRLALARSLLGENRLLFLDEPTNKLDREGVRSVRDLVREMSRDHGVAVVLTTHVLEEAEELCTDLCILRHGEAVAQGPLDRLLLAAAPQRRVRIVAGGPRAPTAPEGVPSVERIHVTHAGTDRYLVEVLTSDVRRATPALLEWLRSQSLSLHHMETERTRLADLYHAHAE